MIQNSAAFLALRFKTQGFPGQPSREKHRRDWNAAEMHFGNDASRHKKTSAAFLALRCKIQGFVSQPSREKHRRGWNAAEMHFLNDASRHKKPLRRS